MPKDNEIPPGAFALVFIPGEKEKVYLPRVEHIDYHTLADFLQSLAKLSSIVSKAMLDYMGGDGSKQDPAPGDNWPRFNGLGDN